MASANYESNIKCSVCGRQDEGIRVGNWLFNFKLCETCVSYLFRMFNPTKLKKKPKEDPRCVKNIFPK